MEEEERLNGRVRLMEQALYQARARIRELEQDNSRYGMVMRQIQRVLLAVPVRPIEDARG